MDVSVIILLVAVSVFSVVLHEVAHGYAARMLGDDTAERAGRLTLNPIPHLDPIGSVLLPIIGAITQVPIIGWAKPVPYNPANLWKDRQWGPLKVALAGPLTNLALLVIFGLAARFSYGRLDGDLVAGFVLVAFVNASLGLFNLIPIPPLDGSKLVGLFSPRLDRWFEGIGFSGILVVFLLLYVAGGALYQAIAFLVGLVTGLPLGG